MVNQKKITIPQVDFVEVLDFDATADFTTSIIEFPESHKDWSIDITALETLAVPADSFAIDATGSGLVDGSYPGLVLENGAVIDLTVAGNIATVVVMVSGGSGYTNGASYGLVEPLTGTTQPTFTATVTTSSDSTITVNVCNASDGVFKPYKTASTNVAIATNNVIFDDIMPFKFMKLDYTANTTTGLVSIHISH